MHAATVIDALKRLLKAQGITYAVLADGLEISEASVKRMFSRGAFTLQRLEDVCRVAGIEFADLARAVAMDGTGGVAYLTVEQEEEIVASSTWPAKCCPAKRHGYPATIAQASPPPMERGDIHELRVQDDDAVPGHRKLSCLHRRRVSGPHRRLIYATESPN